MVETEMRQGQMVVLANTVLQAGRRRAGLPVPSRHLGSGGGGGVTPSLQVHGTALAVLSPGLVTRSRRF